MIRIEDIIKQSGIIEYLEKRKKFYVRENERCKNNTKAFTYCDVNGFVIEELEYILNHLKEVIKNAENRNK